MSNVIEFRPPTSSGKCQAATTAKTDKLKGSANDRDQINERIAALGGEAIESLGRWRAGLPIEDRTRLARNMDILIRELKVVPGKLDWERYGYQDKESFNRDLSRMRLPETAEPGRRLLAHNTRWLHLLEMIHQYSTNIGEQVTLEALAESLTRGTRFHPTKKIHSRSEKLLYSLKLWANEVDQKQGLLKTYRKIAAARAEHFKLHMMDYSDKTPDFLDFNTAAQKPADDFINIPEDKLDLFNKPLGSMTVTEWDILLDTIPEDSLIYYRGLRVSTESWQANFNPDLTLFCGWTGEGTPSLSWYTDIAHLPRWFIGFNDWADLHLISRYPEDPTEYTTCDPFTTSEGEAPFSLVYAHLVLHPSEGMSRIVPYLFASNEEGSYFEPLCEEHFASKHEAFFAPGFPGQESISRQLQDRIEENYLDVREHWCSTAETLKTHPLLAWSEGRERMIDTEIERLTTGTHTPDE